MSACEPDERTIELPLSGRPDEYHGLFTYHLAQVISRVRRPLTYLELLEQVRADYRARHLVSPSPQADGPDQNRLVLGGAESIGRQPFFLHREPHGTKLRVSGGRLMGLTPGAVLEVFPQPTQSGASASRAHVCVVTSDLLTSEVRPSAFGRNPAPKPSQLIDGSWCEVVTPGPIDFRLKVGLREAPARGEPSPDSRPASRPAVALEDLWRGLAQHREVEGRWVRTIEPVQADWILTWNPDVTGRSEWVLSAGWLSWPLPDADSAANTMAFRFLPTPGSPPTSCLDEIADAFRRISRASGFLRLVQATVPRHREGEGLDFKLGLHLLPRVADEDGGTRQAGTHVRVLRPGDLVSISLTNSGPIRFEAVIFCVDSAYGITQLPLRSPGALLPGESTATPPLEIDSWPLGPEQIVALVYRWAPQRSLDFSGIDQPPIRTNAVVGGSGEVHRNPLDRREFSRRGAKGESLASLTPLAEWLRMAGDTRLNRAGQELSASDYAIQCLSYRVEARRADSGSGRRRD